VSTIEKGDKGEDEIELFHVPIQWISKDQKKLQYPPISYKVSGKEPVNWGHATFQRHAIPRGDWEEWNIHKIHTTKPGIFNNVKCRVLFS
jgi:hypothetical protein